MQQMADTVEDMHAQMR
jgi:hypothetical protein